MHGVRRRTEIVLGIGMRVFVSADVMLRENNQLRGAGWEGDVHRPARIAVGPGAAENDQAYRYAITDPRRDPAP